MLPQCSHQDVMAVECSCCNYEIYCSRSVFSQYSPPGELWFLSPWWRQPLRLLFVSLMLIWTWQTWTWLLCGWLTTSGLFRWTSELPKRICWEATATSSVWLHDGVWFIEFISFHLTSSSPEASGWNAVILSSHNVTETQIKKTDDKNRHKIIVLNRMLCRNENYTHYAFIYH